MSAAQIKAMMTELAPVIREYVAAEQAPLLERIGALEGEKSGLIARCEALEEAAKKPVEIDLAPVEKLIEAEIAKLPPPEPAKEVDKEELAAMVADAVADIPPPEKGEPGEKGTDGVSPEPETIAEAFAPLATDIIVREIGKAVADIPPPEKGDKGDPGDGPDMEEINAAISAMVQAAVATIPTPVNGKDGRGIKSLLIDRDGELVATMDDGSLEKLGPVIGKDGADGKDGRDGFSLEDFDCRVLDDDRTIEFAFKSAEHEHIATLKWPTVIDRGVYRSDEDYDAGDGVTWGGQFYIANEPSKGQKPDQSKDGKPWRLAVRKGRDGKDRTKE